jgi:hypothetical protein
MQHQEQHELLRASNVNHQQPIPMNNFNYQRFIFVVGPIVILSFGVYSILFNGGFNPIDSSLTEGGVFSGIFGTGDIQDSSVTRCLTEAQYQTIRSSLNDSKIAIQKFWDVENFPLFLSTMHIPRKSWDIQKHKFIQLILEDKTNKSFVAGFSGSSVTAGHGSY